MAADFFLAYFACVFGGKHQLLLILCFTYSLYTIVLHVDIVQSNDHHRVANCSVISVLFSITLFKINILCLNIER